jgi:hypothetical protein
MRSSLPLRTLAAAAAALALTATAYPWGKEGHEALAIVASARLTPDARAAVTKILGSDDLASISVWMDELRQAHFHAGPLGTDPEALRFDHDFPNNNEWHYVDLPLGIPAYTLDSPNARPDDVVHMTEQAVDVLEGGGDKRITRLEALRMLVHFVGDLHQPLHVGNGFYKVGDDGAVTLVTDPAEAEGLPNDKGGNALVFGPKKYDELHAYWDTDLVVKISGGKDPREIAGFLQKSIDADGQGWASTGDYHHWAEAWATESVVAARTAYSGITFGAETPDENGGIRKILITLPSNYDHLSVPLARERLAKAGYHLAEILNAIHWAN